MNGEATVAGIALAGGPGTRMGGQAKADLDIGGRTILARLLDVYVPLFSEILLSVRDRDQPVPPGVVLAPDRFAERSSLTGIHAGLAEMHAEHAFVAACDAPFMQPAVVRLLLGEIRPEYDVVIPLREDGRMEPLCAVYSKRCLEPIGRQLQQGDCKIIRFFGEVRVHVVPVARLREVDAELASFMNVNTPEDLERARGLARQRGL